MLERKLVPRQRDHVKTNAKYLRKWKGEALERDGISPNICDIAFGCSGLVFPLRYMAFLFFQPNPDTELELSTRDIRARSCGSVNLFTWSPNSPNSADLPRANK
jgi:hypothetical protein